MKPGKTCMSRIKFNQKLIFIARYHLLSLAIDKLDQFAFTGSMGVEKDSISNLHNKDSNPLIYGFPSMNSRHDLKYVR